MRAGALTRGSVRRRRQRSRAHLATFVFATHAGHPGSSPRPYPRGPPALACVDGVHGFGAEAPRPRRRHPAVPRTHPVATTPSSTGGRWPRRSSSTGPERVAARTRELADRLTDALAGVRGVRLVTPRSAELSAGIVRCDVGDVPLGDAAVRAVRALV
ncbi:hypothetical protein ACL02O_29705 [Micromonospora sp. MS34]|uniref:hypothetical protein n=1 Tax=Micromonospora sp. MS34 TaxID=3385971 RepID=UPI0039A17493